MWMLNLTKFVPATFPLDIVTPEKTVLSENVVSLQIHAVDGSLGILAGHAPMLARRDRSAELPYRAGRPASRGMIRGCPPGRAGYRQNGGHKRAPGGAAEWWHGRIG